MYEIRLGRRLKRRKTPKISGDAITLNEDRQSQATPIIAWVDRLEVP
jgi:hypothetical protein